MNGSDTPSYYWLLCIIYVCHLLNHISYSKDYKIPDHRLTTDGGDYGSTTGTSEGSQPKTTSTRVSNGSFRSRGDQNPSAVKPMLEFDPKENFFSLSLQEHGEQITDKGSKVQSINFILGIENQKVECIIAYSIDQQTFEFRAIIGHEDP